jgi:uncharacterized protein (TIGR00730 family)
MVASRRRERQKGAMPQAAASSHQPARAVAVFCGSRTGHDPALLAATQRLGAGLAAHGIGVVYGGGRIGLMGALADAALAAGGTVTGVIPAFLTQWEVAHDGLTALHVTHSMHSRKQMMFELSDGFVCMPGGFGTLDETVEIITWRQLRLHDKPVFVVDVNGWAAAFLTALRGTVEQGFAAESSLELFEVVSSVDALLRRLKSLPVPAPASAARL